MSVYRAGYKNRGPVTASAYTVGVRTCISFSNRTVTGTPTPSRRLGVWRLPRLLAPRRTSIYLVGCLRFIEVPRGAVALRKIQRMNLNFVEPVSGLGDSESRPSLCLYIYITSGLSLVEGWFSVHYIVTGGSWIEETALLDSALEAIYHRSCARYSISKCHRMTQNCENQRIYSKHKVCVLIPQSR